MSGFRGFRGLLCALALLVAAATRADIYDAAKADVAKDYTRAFQLYLELAELGNVPAQENVAWMYVKGEGVKRDNVLGYAWASIAHENGDSADMKSIIDQIEPHLTDAARKRVAEVTSKFNKAALQKSLLPLPKDAQAARPAGDTPCEFLRPGNPDEYYPDAALKEGISGAALVEFTVMPDGRPRNPRVWYSVPNGVFEDATRKVVLNSIFKPRLVRGVAMPCTLRITVRFGFQDQSNPKIAKGLADSRARAEAGDPMAQLVFSVLRNASSTKVSTNIDLDGVDLKAAQAGIPAGQALLGLRLYSQRDLPDAVTETPKAVAWLTRAADAGRVDAKATLAMMTLKENPDAAAYARAYQWLEEAAKAEYRDGMLYFSALLAASPEAVHRDPKRALQLLGGKLKPFVATDPTSDEIRAAAHAMLGDFDAAKLEQKRAIRDANRLGWDTAPQAARLKLYESGQTWTGNLFPY